MNSEKNLNIALVAAIKSKKGLRYIQDLVAEGADINYVDRLGKSVWEQSAVIDLAAMSGDLEVVKWFVGQGAKPFTHEILEQTQTSKLINSACNSGNIELVEWLLNNGVNSSEIILSEATSSDNYLSEEMSSNNFELVQWLVEEKGIAIDNYSIADAIPNHQIVHWLFEHGAQVRDDGRDMSRAVFAEDLELVQLLYAKGARLNKYLLSTIGRSCNSRLNEWLIEKLGQPTETESYKNGEYFYNSTTECTWCGGVSKHSMEVESNYFHSSQYEEIITGTNTVISVGKNIWIARPLLSIEKGAALYAEGNIYLFRSVELKCTDSKITAGGNIYLPSKEHVYLSNCEIKAKSVNYFDNLQEDSAGNIEAYAGIELFKNNCDLLGDNSPQHDEL